MHSAISPRQIEIIEAASRLITTRGVAGLTTKNLAVEMQFTEGAIYRHFSGKEEIILSMLDYLHSNLYIEYESRVAEIKDPVEKFRLLFKCRIKYFIKHPNFAVVVFTDGLLAESDAVNNAVLNIMTKTRNHLIDILIQGQNQCIFTEEVAVEEMATIVMGAFRQQMNKWRLSQFNFNLRKEGNSLINSLLYLIRTK